MIRAVVLTESVFSWLVLWVDRRVLARRLVRPMVLMTLGLSAGAVAMIGISPWYEVVVNKSDSLAGTLYLVLVGAEPACGDRFVYRMPDTAPYFAGERMVKIALGCAGSQVRIRGRHVYVDGLDAGTAKPFAHNGDFLAASGRSGRLPEGTWYAYTPHPDSFDSRYAVVGWVGRDQLVGRAIRLF